MKKSLIVISMALMVLAAALAPGQGMAAERLVAVIMPGGLPSYQAAHEAFTAIFQSGGGGAKVFVQKPNPDRMSITNSIRRAVQAGAEILVTYGTPATLIAKQEAKSVPVLFAEVYDPVGSGLVKTLAAPGVEITGATSHVPLDTLVRNLLRLRPITTLGILYTGSEGGSELQRLEMEDLAGKNGFAALRQDVGSEEKVVSALENVLGRIDALYLSESTFVGLHAAEIVDKARARGVPVISQLPGLGERGAVLNLEADPEEQGKLLAVHTLQVLSGQKAFILPVRVPKKITLVLNRNVAQQLSLAVPDELLQEAQRIIE